MKTTEAWWAASPRLADEWRSFAATSARSSWARTSCSTSAGSPCAAAAPGDTRLAELADDADLLNPLLTSRTSPDIVTVLILDQFEELFTLAEQPQRQSFLRLLSAVAPFQQIHTHIVATLRVDYTPELFSNPDLYALATAHSIGLRAMTSYELKQAIAAPLAWFNAQAGTTKAWQEALADRLVQLTLGDPTLLPLLQVTLESIWMKGRLTLEQFGTITDASVEWASQNVLVLSDPLAGAVQMWDLTRRQQIGSAVQIVASRTALTPNRNLLLAVTCPPQLTRQGYCAAERVQALRLGEGTLMAEPLVLEPTLDTKRIVDMAVSPDSRLLAISTDAQFPATLRIWDLEHQRVVADLPTRITGRLAFSHDGRFLANADAQIEVWDVDAWRRLGPPLTDSNSWPVHTVGFTTSGNLITVSGERPTITTWEGSVNALIERACRLANANLSQGDWEKYVGAEVPYERTCPEAPEGEFV